MRDDHQQVDVVVGLAGPGPYFAGDRMLVGSPMRKGEAMQGDDADDESAADRAPGLQPSDRLGSRDLGAPVSDDDLRQTNGRHRQLQESIDRRMSDQRGGVQRGMSGTPTTAERHGDLRIHRQVLDVRGLLSEGIAAGH